MMPFQLDPRRYYPDAQEQSILIPYLRKYFKFPERSPERNRIASEVSNMLSKFSPHWTHRAVRLWFNNNRTTYIKNDNTNNSFAQNSSNSTKVNSMSMSQNLMSNQYNSTNINVNPTPPVPIPQKPKIGLPPISYFASTPSSTMPSSLPSIEEFVSSSPFPRSIPTSPRGSSSDNMLNLHSSNPSNSNNNKNLESLLNEANQNTQDFEKFIPIMSKINQICDDIDFRDNWPNYSNIIEFPPRQFSFDLSSLLNTSPQIWINKKFVETELPKIDFYSVDSGMDSYIIDESVFIHQGSEFVKVSDMIPPDVSCYTTSNNFIWAITKSKEIFKIDIATQELPTSLQDPALPSADNIAQDNSVNHVQLALSFPSSRICLCPCDDNLILYSHDSPSLTIAYPDMKIENIRLSLISPSISLLKAKSDYVACSMKNNIAISLNDLNSGSIIRHFIGHSKESNHLQFLEDKLLASSAKDSNIRLWDFNIQDPIMTLKTPRKTCRGITGTGIALISCLDNATVNIVDLRMPNEFKPLMAFNLENSNSSVNPISVNYDAEENSLNLFLHEMHPQAKLRHVYRTYTNLL